MRPAGEAIVQASSGQEGGAEGAKQESPPVPCMRLPNPMRLPTPVRRALRARRKSGKALQMTSSLPTPLKREPNGSWFHNNRRT